MTKEVPADWTNAENPENRVKDQPPLNNGMKGTKRHCQAGDQFEEKYGADSTPKETGPSGVWTLYGSAIQLRLSLVEPES